MEGNEQKGLARVPARSLEHDHFRGRPSLCGNWRTASLVGQVRRVLPEEQWAATPTCPPGSGRPPWPSRRGATSCQVIYKPLEVTKPRLDPSSPWLVRCWHTLAGETPPRSASCCSCTRVQARARPASLLSYQGRTGKGTFQLGLEGVPEVPSQGGGGGHSWKGMCARV